MAEETSTTSTTTSEGAPSGQQGTARSAPAPSANEAEASHLAKQDALIRAELGLPAKPSKASRARASSGEAKGAPPSQPGGDPPADELGDGDGAADGEDEGEAPPAGAKPDAKDPNEQPAPAWKVGAIIRREEKLRRDVERLEELEQTLSQREQQLAQREQQLAELDVDDPEQLLERVAKRRGLDANALYDRVTRRRLNQGQPDSNEALEEVRALRQQIEADRKARDQAEQGRQQQQQQQEVRAQARRQSRLLQAISDEDTDWERAPELESFRNDPRPEARLTGQSLETLRKQYPNLAQLPAAIAIEWAESALEQAKPGTPLTHIAAFLDNRAIPLVQGLQRRYGGRTQAEGAAPQGERPPQAPQGPQNPGKPQRRVPNAGDAAESSGRSLSEAERIRRQDDIIKRQLGL